MKKNVLKVVCLCLALIPFKIGAFTPSDTQIAQQAYLNRIRAYEAWDLMSAEAKARQVVVAVLDTGVDIHHPDLLDSLWVNDKEIPNNGKDDDNNSYIDDIYGWNFVESNNDVKPVTSSEFLPEALNHGTIIAGIIAAGFDNGRGIAGLTPNAKIMSIRALDSQGNGNTLVLAQAIDYAVENGADIINLSLVGRQVDPQLVESIKNAYNHGVAIVAAAGNEEKVGSDLNLDPHYPVCEVDNLNRVLGVAALNLDNSLSPFSNYGSACIDLSAPGTGIFSTTVYNPEHKLTEYYSGGWSGTSVASPIVVGALANAKKVAPELRLEQLYDIVIGQSKNIQAANPNTYRDLGGGLVDMAATVSKAQELASVRESLFVVAPAQGAPMITVFSPDGIVQKSWYAYDRSYQIGSNFTIAADSIDLERRIVTAPARNGGPHIRVFTADGQLISQFMAYHTRFRGGISVAAADINNDGRSEIITVPTQGGGPHVKIFTLDGQLISQFMAYHEQFHGGVQLATLDIDDDGQPEIVTLPLQSGSAHVRIFDHTGQLKGQFMAFDPALRGTYSLATGDLNHDKQPDITVILQNETESRVRTLDGAGNEIATWLAFAKLNQKSYPVQITIGDVTGDMRDELLFIPRGDRGDRLIQVFDLSGMALPTIALPSGIATANSLSLMTP